MTYPTLLPGTRGYSWCAVLTSPRPGPGIGCGGDEGILALMSLTPVTKAGLTPDTGLT